MFVAVKQNNNNILPNNIEKMLVYDKSELLYEEHFKDIKNIIEFY
jgi:hypothetical protein